jgi:hypothetical protein
MYAAHFAAALAIKTHAPKAPIWALMAGAFLPDFIAIALGLAGIEPSQGPAFFDDWSHSLAMTALWASLLALAFWTKGMTVALPAWLSVVSHFFWICPFTRQTWLSTLIPRCIWDGAFGESARETTGTYDYATLCLAAPFSPLGYPLGVSR